MGLGTTNSYGTTDGFVWNDETDGCLSKKRLQSSIIAYTGAAASYTGTTISNPTDVTLVTVSSTPSDYGDFKSLSPHVVVNPCRLRLSPPSATYTQTIGDPQQSVQIKPTAL